MAASSAPSATRSVGRMPWARAFLLVASLLPVLAYVVAAVQRVGYPYELTYFEGSTVEVSARVVAGQPLYAAPTLEWTPWPYPPLYFWLSGELAHLTGLSLLPLRLLSFVASLAAFALVALIVRRFSGSALAGAVAAGLFAATFRVSGAWFDTARVDSLLLALLLAAIYMGMRARGWRGGLALGAVLLVGFLTKQNTLIVAAPILLWLLWRRRAVGVAALVTLAVTVVGSTLVGDLVTGGWYSRYVIRQLVSQSWALRWIVDFWVKDLLEPFVVSLVVVVVGLVLWWRQGHRPARRLPSDDTAYLVVCVVGLLGTSWAARVHEGGYANVSMPAQAGVCVVLGCLLAAVLRSRTVTDRVVAAFGVALVLQAAVMTGWQVTVVPSEADRPAGDRFVASLRTLPGRVLVPTHPYYLRMAGLPTHASSIAIYDLLHATGGRTDMGDALPWSLDGVSAVLLDNETDVQLFGPELATRFTRVTTRYIPPGLFLPVSDVATNPTVLYVRTTDLPLLPEPLTG